MGLGVGGKGLAPWNPAWEALDMCAGVIGHPSPWTGERGLWLTDGRGTKGNQPLPSRPAAA